MHRQKTLLLDPIEFKQWGLGVNFLPASVPLLVRARGPHSLLQAPPRLSHQQPCGLHGNTTAQQNTLSAIIRGEAVADGCSLFGSSNNVTPPPAQHDAAHRLPVSYISLLTHTFPHPMSVDSLLGLRFTAAAFLRSMTGLGLLMVRPKAALGPGDTPPPTRPAAAAAAAAPPSRLGPLAPAPAAAAAAAAAPARAFAFGLVGAGDITSSGSLLWSCSSAKMQMGMVLRAGVGWCSA
jgi:hypothetical protein